MDFSARTLIGLAADDVMTCHIDVTVVNETSLPSSTADHAGSRILRSVIRRLTACISR